MTKAIQNYSQTSFTSFPYLFHGSDARMVEMTFSEREEFRNSCITAGNYLYKIWLPYQEDLYDSILYHTKGEKDKPLLTLEKDKELLTAISYTGGRINENPMWRYGNLYVRSKKQVPVLFAMNAWAGGELGRFTYYMYYAALKYQIPEWRPNADIKKPSRGYKNSLMELLYPSCLRLKMFRQVICY